MTQVHCMFLFHTCYPSVIRVYRSCVPHGCRLGEACAVLAAPSLWPPNTLTLTQAGP